MTENTKPGFEVGGMDPFADRDETPSFGTFNGVFRPTILTILGVMMYLREGWVVGNAGLAGALIVIGACYLITGTTAMSISSITTNIRVGSGGVFSIISQSLGLEVGGSVGIPLYLAQGLSAALYMRGIVETWIYLFPSHPDWAVTLGVFCVSFPIAYFGAKLVFRAQVMAMVGVILALASMWLGLRTHDVNLSPVLWGEFADGNLKTLFAVFFPAATGIMVGSSLSGSLRNPRKSIPVGTMSAWAVSGLVYTSIAVWYALVGTPDALRDTSSIFAVEKAFWGPLVLLGVFSSCLSATLSSLVAAPRVLQALSTHRIVPKHTFFEKLSNGEPRNATLFTGALVFAALFLGDFNAIAQILTMFFLVIYFMINLVLFIEHRLKMISFRPVFQIPSWVPIVGSISSFTAILLISPLTGLFAIAFIMGIYAYLDRRHLKTPWETVHSGIFASIANWAAKKVCQTSELSVKRSWKPDLMIPVERSTQLEGYYRLCHALTMPRGSIQVVGFAKTETDAELEGLYRLIEDFQEDDLFATAAVIHSPDFIGGLSTCLAVKSGSFFKPNTLFTSLENRTEDELQQMLDMAKANQMGVVFLANHPESRLGRERSVNLWVRDQSPDWKLGLKLANLDYAVLMSYQLKRNWPAQIRILSVVGREEDVETTRAFLISLLDSARMSDGVEVHVEHGNFTQFVERAPMADLNIMGLSDRVNKQALESMVQRCHSSCLFVLDSGNESALA